MGLLPLAAAGQFHLHSPVTYGELSRMTDQQRADAPPAVRLIYHQSNEPSTRSSSLEEGHHVDRGTAHQPMLEAGDERGCTVVARPSPEPQADLISVGRVAQLSEEANELRCVIG